MPKLNLELEFGNEAMESLADALIAISVSLTRPGFRDRVLAGDNGWLYDVNGNYVGEWGVVSDE